MDSSQLKSFSKSPETNQIDLTFKGHFNKSNKEDYVNKNKVIEMNKNQFPRLKSLLRGTDRKAKRNSRKNEEAYKENSFISKMLMPSEVENGFGSMIYGEDTLENSIGYDDTTTNNYNKSNMDGTATPLGKSPNLSKKKHISKTQKKPKRNKDLVRTRNFSVHF